MGKINESVALSSIIIVEYMYIYKYISLNQFTDSGGHGHAIQKLWKAGF